MLQEFFRHPVALATAMADLEILGLDQNCARY
jgi:hypothetical protein